MIGWKVDSAKRAASLGETSTAMLFARKVDEGLRAGSHQSLWSLVFFMLVQGFAKDNMCLALSAWA